MVLVKGQEPKEHIIIGSEETTLPESVLELEKEGKSESCTISVC